MRVTSLLRLRDRLSLAVEHVKVMVLAEEFIQPLPVMAVTNLTNTYLVSNRAGS